MAARENSGSPSRWVALGTGHSNPVVHSGMGTQEAPQGSPVGKEYAAVDRTLKVEGLAVDLETFVERCSVAALGPGVAHALG